LREEIEIIGKWEKRGKIIGLPLFDNKIHDFSVNRFHLTKEISFRFFDPSSCHNK